MRVPACLCLASIALAALPATARAEGAASPIDRLRAEVEELGGGPAAEVAPRELERARELLRTAERARDAGESGVAEALLAIVPLQIRLVREMVRAAELEAQAAEVEARSLEAERRARVARDQLEQVLERLVALTMGRPFE